MLLVVPESRFSIAASADTVTCVSTAPVCSVTLTVAVDAVSTFTFSTTDFLKPFISTSTLYITGSRSGAE